MYMEYFIPTYEQAKEIVNLNKSFFESIHYIDGYKISVFNYRFSTYSEFINPVKDKNYNAKELRGLTYVFNEDGTLFERFIMLNKFWNINEVEETQLTNLKNKKIKSIYNKEDGSLITFIKLPNGKIVAKTKSGFDNEQAKTANEILLTNKNIFNFVKDCLDKNLITLWEYVSFKNRIVLNYNNTNLILLKVRNNKTGQYIDIENFRGLGFDVVSSISNKADLEEILEWLNKAENVEGVVITFEDDTLVKVKSKWYVEKHFFLTDITNRENIIIEMILNETIDDIKSSLNSDIDREKICWIQNIENIVKNFILKRSSEVDELVSNYNGDMKEFALKYKDDKNFSISVNVIKGKQDSYTAVKNWLLTKTKKLEQARNFINKGYI